MVKIDSQYIYCIVDAKDLYHFWKPTCKDHHNPAAADEAVLTCLFCWPLAPCCHCNWLHCGLILNPHEAPLLAVEPMAATTYILSFEDPKKRDIFVDSVSGKLPNLSLWQTTYFSAGERDISSWPFRRDSNGVFGLRQWWCFWGDRHEEIDGFTSC